MKSIRQSTFETNSSSAHSLTLVTKSLREKLQSRDLFYVGPFEMDSESDETSVNKIEEKNCITIEEAIKRVKEYLTANPDFGLPDDFNLDMLTPEFVKENYWSSDYDLYNTFYEILDPCKRGECYIPAEDLFADKKSESCLIGDVLTYDLKDGDTLEIRNVSISC